MRASSEHQLKNLFSISNIIGGSNFALFCLALLNPWANRWGAHAGFLTGLGSSVWIYVGSKTYPPPVEFTKRLPTEVIGCQNFTLGQPEDILVNDPPVIANLYWISYMYLGTFGFIVCITVGSLISILTGFIDSSDHLRVYFRSTSGQLGLNSIKVSKIHAKYQSSLCYPSSEDIS